MKRKTKKEQQIEALADGVGKANSVVKKTTKNRGEKKTGNSFTPVEEYGGESYVDTKTRLKIYCHYNPRKQIEVLDAIIDKAKTNPKYAQLFVAMTGGTDPTEAKITGEVTQTTESPLSSLSIDELRALKTLKSLQNDGKLDDFKEFLEKKKQEQEAHD